MPTPIIGTAAVPFWKAESWARERGATREFVSLAVLFWTISPSRTGVRPDVAYAQAAKETGFGKFGGVITPEYHNTCGLKTRTGGSNNDPLAHQYFPDWRTGVTAHLDHLAIYAGHLVPDSPDPRHFAWIKGRAPNVEDLGGNWAPNPDYGHSIIRDYLNPMTGNVGTSGSSWY